MTFTPDIFDPANVMFFRDGGTCTGNVVTGTVSGMSGGGCSALTYTHELSDFNPATDILTSALLFVPFLRRLSAQFLRKIRPRPRRQQFSEQRPDQR